MTQAKNQRKRQPLPEFLLFFHKDPFNAASNFNFLYETEFFIFTKMIKDCFSFAEIGFPMDYPKQWEFLHNGIISA